MIKEIYYTTTEIFVWSIVIAGLSWLFLYDNLFVVGFIFGGSFWWLNKYYHISKKPTESDKLGV